MKRNGNADERENRGDEGVWEGVSPSLVGEGAMPPPQNFFFDFLPGNGAFWSLVLMLV